MDHKEIAENHEYCRKHNLDFESWEEHGIHRVNSRGHWTCDVCYTDFKSQSGLTVHRTQVCCYLFMWGVWWVLTKPQQHKDAKVVSCPACKQTFKGGNAGLTMHIEGNKCQGGITRGEMHQRAQAMQHGRALTHSEFSKTEDVAQQFKQRGVEVPIPGNDGNNLNITFDKLGDYFKQTHDKFVCPCGSKFAKKQGFWQHLQSPAHHAAKKVMYVHPHLPSFVPQRLRLTLTNNTAASDATSSTVLPPP